MNLVEEINIGRGDQYLATVPSNGTFIISEIADGIAVPRRQRW